MIELNPQIIKKEGENAFVVLDYQKYQQIIAELEEYEDLKTLREAKANSDGKMYSINEAKDILGI